MFFFCLPPPNSLKKAQPRLRVIPALRAKFVGTLTLMSFHASEWTCATRAFLRSLGITSGHIGPRSCPGVVLHHLRFGYPSTRTPETEVFMKVINLRDIYPHYTQDYDERVPYRMSKRKSRKSKRTELGNNFVLPVYKNPSDISPTKSIGNMPPLGQPYQIGR